MNDTEVQEVRAILADLQGEIRRHRMVLGETDEALPPDRLLHVRTKQTVNPHLPIGWPVMPKGPLSKLSAYAQKVTRRLLRWYINPIVAQQNEYNSAATQALAGLQRDLDARTVSSVSRDDLEALQQRHEQESETVRLRLQRLENWFRDGQGIELPAEPGRSGGMIDYFLLAAQQRNARQMAERLGDFDDIWTSLLVSQGRADTERLPILDIGCGRGELVAHFRQLGLPAYGLDLNSDAISIGLENGLDLRQEDASAHLAALPDRSLAGVVMIQVVEHLAPEVLAGLLRLIERKLALGGFVLAETLNPACLFALSNWYLMDPSHKMPVHSATARFLLEQAGFHRIEIRYIHPVPEKDRLLAVGEGQPSETLLGRLAMNIDRLNDFLYGPQDYAAIAYKPES